MKAKSRNAGAWREGIGHLWKNVSIKFVIIKKITDPQHGDLIIWGAYYMYEALDKLLCFGLVWLGQPAQMSTPPLGGSETMASLGGWFENVVFSDPGPVIAPVRHIQVAIEQQEGGGRCPGPPISPVSIPALCIVAIPIPFNNTLSNWSWIVIALPRARCSTLLSGMALFSPAYRIRDVRSQVCH